MNQMIIGLIFAACATVTSLSAQSATSFSSQQSLKVGVINTRRCMEEAKASKHERTNLEKMKSQMESVLKDKEKAIQSIQSKLQDEDYMDSLSDEAERELKHKRKTLMEEGMELNKQFVDTLENANMKIVQSLIEQISKICKEIAVDPTQPLDIIFTSEACTYYGEQLDITDRVLAKLDARFDAEQKEQVKK